MTRSKSFPKQCTLSADGESRTWVMLIESNILNDHSDDGNKNPVIVKLRHPRTGTGAMFLFSADDSIVQEVFSFTEEKRSWFIDDTVKEDGRLYLSTPVDPGFLVLPYLKKAKESGQVMPLDDVLVDSLFPQTARLLKCSAMKNIHMLADMKGDAKFNAWSYNEDKTLKWLVKKTERVAQVLMEKNIGVKEAVSDNFVKSTNAVQDEDKGPYLAYACGLVSEYLSDDLSSKLHGLLNITQSDVDNCKRKSCDDVNDKEVKKLKRDSDVSSTPKPAKSTTSSNAKSKLKMSAGCQSITSFFKKS